MAIILLGTGIAFGATEAQAVPITFSTTGVFSASGTNVASFSDGSGMTTITFNGALDSVFTPAGAGFGNIVVTTTEPPNVLGPTVTGNFALNFNQVSPAGTGTILSALSGTLGFNSGIATLMFATTQVTINGFTYTVNPIYTIALPGSRRRGHDNYDHARRHDCRSCDGSSRQWRYLVLLGGALLGLVVVQRRLRSA